MCVCVPDETTDFNRDFKGSGCFDRGRVDSLHFVRFIKPMGTLEKKKKSPSNGRTNRVDKHLCLCLLLVTFISRNEVITKGTIGPQLPSQKKNHQWGPRLLEQRVEQKEGPHMEVIMHLCGSHVKVSVCDNCVSVVLAQSCKAVLSVLQLYKIGSIHL